MHEIALELTTELRAVGCPLQVVEGPEPSETATWGRERIVLEHATGDRFTAPLSQRTTPKYRFVRLVAAKLKIYAQTPRGGALAWEHRRRAEHVLDLVLVALEKVILARHNNFVVGSGGFFDPPDMQGTATRAGAAYELAFTVDRAVVPQTWDGELEETAGGLGGLNSTTRVFLADDDNTASTPPATAEKACGA